MSKLDELKEIKSDIKEVYKTLEVPLRLWSKMQELNKKMRNAE